MGNRRKARELALQALYFLDVNETDFKKGLEDFSDQHEADLTDGVAPFFQDLINGVMDQRKEIDRLMDKWAKNWKISRMPAVDRNIMRLAVFELIWRQDIPASVSINEAVEIGKKFGTRDSGPFINGVLDKVVFQLKDEQLIKKSGRGLIGEDE